MARPSPLCRPGPNWVSTTPARENHSLATSEEETVPEEDAPDNSQAPSDEIVDEADLEDENTPVDGSAPADEGDTVDGTETYLSSYQPLANSVSATAPAAALTASGSERLAASYSPLAWTIPVSATEDRYRYVGSCNRLR